MNRSFNSKEYINKLALEIIHNFTNASYGTTPTLVGTAKETEIRTKLQSIFPPLVKIGTGCVIDSDSNTSKQTDVIIYEKEYCPIFSINNTPDASYFPCESVIAVGEIKSKLDNRDLLDSLEKIKSVKALKRFLLRSDGIRNYGSKLIVHAMEHEEYNQQNNLLDQIYGFVFCENFGLSVETLLERLERIYNKTETYLLPNIILSLNDGIITYFNQASQQILDSKNDATGLVFFNFPTGNFQFLLSRINYFINYGRSTHILPFEKYIIEEPTGNMLYKYLPFNK